MSYSQRRLTDPRELRALAHPVRVAIIEQLNVHGALTATQLADRIDESPSNCSWHLRKLAEHGFVEEAEGGTGRQRPWQATTMGLSWDEYESGDAAVASEALSRVVIEREVDRLHTTRARLRSDSREWQHASDVTQGAAWLTAAELRELNDAVKALLLDKLDRFDDPAKRPPGSRICSLVHWGVPAYDMAEPTPDVAPAEED